MYKDIMTRTMEEIEEECRNEGYYPDLVELYDMAMVRLTQEEYRWS